jgi:hypothetical protein
LRVNIDATETDQDNFKLVFKDKASLFDRIGIASEITRNTFTLSTAMNKNTPKREFPIIQNFYQFDNGATTLLSENTPVGCTGGVLNTENEDDHTYTCANMDGNIYVYKIGAEKPMVVVNSENFDKKASSRSNLKMKVQYIKDNKLETIDALDLDVTFSLNFDYTKLRSVVKNNIPVAVTGKWLTKMPYGPNTVTGHWNSFKRLRDGSAEEGGDESGFLPDKTNSLYTKIEVFVNGEPISA